MLNPKKDRESEKSIFFDGRLVNEGHFARWADFILSKTESSDNFLKNEHHIYM